MIKMAFVAPIVAIMMFIGFIDPVLSSNGIDPFGKFRTQSAKIERKIHAVMTWSPSFSFWK
jgi:hypothetical protein